MVPNLFSPAALRDLGILRFLGDVNNQGERGGDAPSFSTFRFLPRRRRRFRSARSCNTGECNAYQPECFALAFVVVSTFVDCICRSRPLADSRAFFAYLYGGNEQPGAGDPNAYGMATVVLLSATSLCYSIILHNAAAATAAHIHRGAAGVAGPIVIQPCRFRASVPTRVANCIARVRRPSIAAIRANPQFFIHVNVHNGCVSGGCSPRATAIAGPVARD